MGGSEREKVDQKLQQVGLLSKYPNRIVWGGLKSVSKYIEFVAKIENQEMPDIKEEIA